MAQFYTRLHIKTFIVLQHLGKTTEKAKFLRTRDKNISFVVLNLIISIIYLYKKVVWLSTFHQFRYVNHIKYFDYKITDTIYRAIDNI